MLILPRRQTIVRNEDAKRALVGAAPGEQAFYRADLTAFLIVMAGPPACLLLILRCVMAAVT